MTTMATVVAAATTTRCCSISGSSCKTSTDLRPGSADTPVNTTARGPARAGLARKADFGCGTIRPPDTVRRLRVQASATQL